MCSRKCRRMLSYKCFRLPSHARHRSAITHSTTAGERKGRWESVRVGASGVLDRVRAVGVGQDREVLVLGHELVDQQLAVLEVAVVLSATIPLPL